MIIGFKDRGAEDIYDGADTRAARKTLPKALWKVAQRKLDMLQAARNLQDLRSPPGNRLEALKGNLEGLYSIRINDQYRIVFAWTPEGPKDVAIVDYHKG